MSELPAGVPFIDLLVPPGTKAKAQDLQTHLDLVGGGLWRVRVDDGTMEDSIVPMQPIRGTMERIQVYRRGTFMGGETMDEAAALAVDTAKLVSPALVAVGVYGVYAWAMVLVEDVRWLHGLVLLDWLYNPRLDERGGMVPEDDESPPDDLLRAKLAVFRQIWTPARSAAFARRLGQGALQPIDDLQALTLLGPDGGFDPRYWQQLAMQVAISEVRALAAQSKDAGPRPASSAPSGPGAIPPAPKAPAAPPPPADGLSPLARAMKEAEERAASPAPQRSEPPPEPPAQGPEARWARGPQGLLLVVPSDGLDARTLKKLRESGTEGLTRREQPSAEDLQAWRDAGAHFVVELPSLSRLFLDGRPLDGPTFEAAAVRLGPLSTLECHLPRVARVLALLVPADPRPRILACSDPTLSPAAILAAAGPRPPFAP